MKRLLAILLIVTMLISVAPMAFALDIPDINVQDIDTQKLQLAIEQFSKFVDGKLDGSDAPAYDASKGEYEVNCGSYYVALGDSTGTGMAAGPNGENPEGYGNYGYKTVVPESFAYKLAKKLDLDIETQYIQLALAGMRTNDLRYVLDESFTPDEYTLDCTLSRINNHTGGLDIMRADYKEALAKADLVTLSIGSCNVSDFFSTQVKGAAANLLKSCEELMNLLNGNMGAQIRPVVDEYLNLEASYYAMDWDSYLDAEGMKHVEAVLGEVKAVLAEVGVPEVYTLDVGKMIQPMMDEQFGPGIVSLNILMDIPIHQLAADMVEFYLYGYATHALSYIPVVEKIHEMSDAQLVVLSQYNSMDDMIIAFEDMEIPLGQFSGQLCKIMSDCISAAAGQFDSTAYVEIFGVESNIDRKLKENGNVVELTAYLSSLAGGIADFHATGAGQTYMAEQVYKALKVTRGNHVWDGNVCSVCGAAKGDEGGEHDNCVADIFSDIKAEAWYHDSICYVYNENLMKGMSADKFSPSTATSRAMIVTTLYRMEGSPAVTGENGFEDVKAGAWYADAITWASENGIVNGLGNGIFGPNKDVTREQLAAMLYRYAEYKGMDVSEKATLEGFTDVGEIHGWALDAMKWANAAELINGRSETTINPLNNTMRSELATLLYRWNTELAK